MLVGLLAACGGGGGGGAGGDAAPDAEVPGELLTVSVRGGLAGAAGGVFVAVDGGGGVMRAAGTAETVVRDELSAADLATLTDLVDGEAFAALPPQTFDEPAPDAFQYTFVHEDRYVMADDASLEPPLDEIVEILRPWLTAGG